MKTAILVDGGFFTRRFRRVFPQTDPNDAVAVAQRLHRMCTRHLCRLKPNNNGNTRPVRISELYRIFFYDCPPLTKRVHQPRSNQSLNLATTPEALFRHQLHTELRKLRKVALRLGRLDEKNAEWQLRPGVLKALLRGQRRWEDLTDRDFIYYARQKVVDMKIGLDIALLAEKKLVDQIVLVAGDSDFVPAAKHARREGIDFVLDPMWNPVAPDLHEHIDGLRSTCSRPGAQGQQQQEADLLPEADDPSDP